MDTSWNRIYSDKVYGIYVKGRIPMIGRLALSRLIVVLTGSLSNWLWIQN